MYARVILILLVYVQPRNLWWNDNNIVTIYVFYNYTSAHVQWASAKYIGVQKNRRQLYSKIILRSESAVIVKWNLREKLDDDPTRCHWKKVQEIFSQTFDLIVNISTIDRHFDGMD